MVVVIGYMHRWIEGRNNILKMSLVVKVAEVKGDNSLETLAGKRVLPPLFLAVIMPGTRTRTSTTGDTSSFQE